MVIRPGRQRLSFWSYRSLSFTSLLRRWTPLHGRVTGALFIQPTSNLSDTRCQRLLTRRRPRRDSHDLIRCSRQQAAAEQRRPTSVFICISNRLFTSAERLKGTLKACGGAQVDRFYRFGQIYFPLPHCLLRCNLKACSLSGSTGGNKVQSLQRKVNKTCQNDVSNHLICINDA